MTAFPPFIVTGSKTTGDVPTVQANGTVAWQAGAAPGAAVMHGPFTVDHTTAGLNNGVVIYTPTVGDRILDVQIETVIAWNGTTPTPDVGTFTGNTGLWAQLVAAFPDLTIPSAAITDNAGLLNANANGRESLSANANGVTLPVSVANPLKVVVSQNGMKGGMAVGGTTGELNVLILVATPTTP